MLIAHTLRLLGLPRDERKPQAEARLAGIDWPALDWKFAASWAGERREISPGLDLGRDDWRKVIDPETDSQREIEGIDPVYGKLHHLSVWYLARGDDIGIFAADEVSNGVWLVFVPKTVGQDGSNRSRERQ
ncbi:MAG TPA: hypothetical protein VKY22_27050 [Bradyrhizobium sp.]|nr:hypothetical protein [Bradyrhizobium sp.]